ncbi:hypothetical protein [Kurthia sibirica]|uniref:Bacterial Ig domain-containing protein n=1 Tax=Kurthia sibirica TaxID=202750 RepID=A0A2U3AMK0_9BACL|nr:hypothetical protein [Kurthia sibirica]PWI25760.1 hypothetical protein DEX24_06040 [Kurthia sibirica]GEK35454.1 hypothetical protein KSI01_29870 [Kurthia sibirica]
MKKSMLIIVLFLLLSSGTYKASAETTIRLQNNHPITSAITASDIQKTFIIEVSKMSSVTLTIKTDLPNLYSSLENNQADQMSVHWDYAGATVAKPKTWTTTHILKPGKYAIHIKNQAQLNGHFVIAATQKAISSNEIEPNDTQKKAQLLLPNNTKVKGVIGWNDNVDLYKITNVKKYATLEVIVTSTITNMSVQVVNENGRIYFSNNLFGHATVQKPKSWRDSARITKGDYYIVVNSNVATYGQYTLTTKIKEMLPPPPVVKKVIVGSKKVTGQSIHSSKITVKINGKIYKGLTNSKGQYTISIPRQKLNAAIFVRVTSKFGTSDYKKIKVTKK